MTSYIQARVDSWKAQGKLKREGDCLICSVADGKDRLLVQAGGENEHAKPFLGERGEKIMVRNAWLYEEAIAD